MSTTVNPPSPVKQSWLATRLKEPSTYAGIGVIAATVAPYIEAAARSPAWPGILIAVLSGVIASVKAETVA